MRKAGHLARVNPDNLSRAELCNRLQGSKATHMTQSGNAIDNSFEPLHFKLSIARWLKNVIARINSGLSVWSIDAEIKSTYQPHADQLENYLLRVLGLQRRLSLQGNEADLLLSVQN